MIYTQVTKHIIVYSRYMFFEVLIVECELKYENGLQTKGNPPTRQRNMLTLVKSWDTEAMELCITWGKFYKNGTNVEEMSTL